MQRVKRPTAVAVLPNPPEGGTPGYFAAPNPLGGIDATVPGYEWYNSIQEELCAVIEGAGDVLNEEVRNQLFLAIAKKGFQGNRFSIATAAGTADAITGVFVPAVSALTNGMRFHVRAASANATTTPTFTPAPGTIAAKIIVKGANLPLAPGDIAGAGHWIVLQYDQTLDRWVLENPATGVTQRNGGSYAGLKYVGTTGSLTSADAGRLSVLSGSGGTITLPAANDCVAGAVYSFVCGGGSWVISRAGADVIAVSDASLTSLPMRPGDTLTLVSQGSGNTWRVVSGSAQFPAAPGFAVSSAASGWQKLPSRLIIQWGAFSPGASYSTLTFPIAFPNNILSASAVVNLGSNQCFTPIFNFSSATTTGIPVAVTSTAGAPTNVPIRWIAIGF